ncbi:MAG: hypothetical protein QXE31_05215 [Candidatus Woesearchaeota archaeon]
MKINMKKKKNNNTEKNKDKIIETLYKELERKDKIIEKLKEENYVLMRTALKREEERVKK